MKKVDLPKGFKERSRFKKGNWLFVIATSKREVTAFIFDGSSQYPTYVYWIMRDLA